MFQQKVASETEEIHKFEKSIKNETGKEKFSENYASFVWYGKLELRYSPTLWSYGSWVVDYTSDMNASYPWLKEKTENWQTKSE